MNRVLAIKRGMQQGWPGPGLLACLLVLVTPALADELLVSDGMKRRVSRAAVIPDDLQNPGFEEADAAKKLSAWSGVTHAGDSYRVELDESQAFGGKRSLIIENTAKPSWGGAQQIIRAQHLAGREVELSLQVKSKDVTAPGFYALLKIKQMGRDLSFVKTAGGITGGDDWKTVSLRTMLPKETTHLELVLILEGDGRVWIDDVRLEPLAEEK